MPNEVSLIRQLLKVQKEDWSGGNDQVNRAYRKLVSLIITKSWCGPLSEAKLTKAVGGMSRQPVVIALKKLVDNGIVTKEGRSHEPREITEKSLRDLYHYRCAIEGMAARLGAQRATEELGDLIEFRFVLTGILEHHKEFSAEEVDMSGVIFHSRVVEASQNDLLVEAFKRNRDLHSVIFSGPAFSDKPDQVSVFEHRSILDAIESSDPSAAEELMRKHLLRGLEERINQFASQNGGIDDCEGD